MAIFYANLFRQMSDGIPAVFKPYKAPSANLDANSNIHKTGWSGSVRKIAADQLYNQLKNIKNSEFVDLDRVFVGSLYLPSNTQIYPQNELFVSAVDNSVENARRLAKLARSWHP
ncbi:hypothetical protein [Ferrimonas sediminum]|uniref:hypothetical protein n=1 Tax=Ferrimonas sediminum TaxID=718193 RepID=UPI00115FEB37|nr:hypothetical protein [Ferrimonas sediminum]